MTAPPSSALSGKAMLAYVLPALPTAALSLPLAVYIPPLYVENTLLSLGLVGTLFTLSKFIDVITDPLFGWISDRVQFTFGRRRTWLIISVPLLMVSIYKLFHPPTDAGAAYLVTWLFFIYLGYTIILLSHLAWGAELSSGYDARSRIMGWRQVAATFGMLLVLVLPTLGELNGFVTGAAGRADLMSTFLLFILPISVAIPVLSLPDPLPKTPPDKRPLNSLVSVFTGPYLPRILIGDLLVNTALGITGSLYIWLAVYVFKLGDITSLILLVYFGSGTLFVPLWMKLAQRYEKHSVFCAAMLYAMIVLATYSFAATAGIIIIIMAVNMLYGLVYGACIFLSRAMVADAADEDALTSGTPRMGIFFASLGLTGKIGFALGPAIAYNFLEQVGFNPKSEVDGAAENWLLFTFIVPPAIMLGAAGLVLRGHTLTRAKHSDIRKTLEAQTEAQTETRTDP